MRAIQARGRSVGVARVEQRADLALERAIEVLGVASVLDALVPMALAQADAEAVQTVVGLGPPAVEDRQVESAVEHHLLTAGAGRLERTAWRVEPHVDALDQVAAEVDVVVFDEHHALRVRRLATELRDCPQQLLPGVVLRVRLACEDELDGGIAGHERAQALDLGEEERRPLVGGEPARESDGEHVGIEERPRLRDALGGLAATLASLRDAPAHEGEQPLLQHLVQVPELAVVDAIDGPPHGGLGAVVGPVDAHVAAVELPHLGREPGVHVHAVGDVADGHLVGGALGPQRPPHLPGDVAVDRRHGVGVPARPQGQHGHAEVFALVVGIDATEAHEVVLGQAERLAQRPDVLFDQRCRESDRARREPACGW